MTVEVTYQTNTDDFLNRQKFLFGNRMKTKRAAEANYEWLETSSTLLNLFKSNTFEAGGWWELKDGNTVVKSCGAYKYRESLIIGVRYCSFVNCTKYNLGFLHYILPRQYQKAKELNCGSIVMTFNEYNSHFLRLFSIYKSSGKLSKEAFEIVNGFRNFGVHKFNYVDQTIYSKKIGQEKQWYEFV